jgi:hypothetical protein
MQFNLSSRTLVTYLERIWPHPHIRWDTDFVLWNCNCFTQNMSAVNLRHPLRRFAIFGYSDSQIYWYRDPTQISATVTSNATKFPVGDRPSVLTNRFNKSIWNRKKFRVVTGLLTRYNTLRKHLCIMGLIDSSLWNRTEIFRSHFVWVWSYDDTQTHLSGFFFLGPW